MSNPWQSRESAKKPLDFGMLCVESFRERGFSVHGGALMGTKARRILQAGAIPIRNSEICLITSSSGKRWVIPKGCLEPGKTVGDIALQEAWEEAGLRGTLRPQPVGSYLYKKYGDNYHVTVFI